MSMQEIGCCGAYCRTCRAYHAPCAGCTQGYDNGERDIGKARCQIKICCISLGHATCADCPDFGSCSTLGVFHAKNGYKYGKYRQALLFIRERGYEAFVNIADEWSGACGRYPVRAGEESLAAIEDSSAEEGDDAARKKRMSREPGGAAANKRLGVGCRK